MQNEPTYSGGGYPQCEWNAAQQETFITNLKAAWNAYGLSTPLLAFDANYTPNGGSNCSSWVGTLEGSPDASMFNGGAIGVHWYDQYGSGQAPGSGTPATQIGTLYSDYVKTGDFSDVWNTEACEMWFNEGGAEQTYVLNVAWEYADDIVSQINNGLSGWIDWNMILNSSGLPNVDNHNCSAPIQINTSTGTVITNPQYYLCTPYSKYWRPGGKEISTSSATGNLLVAGCVNNDTTNTCSCNYSEY